MRLHRTTSHSLLHLHSHLNLLLNVMEAPSLSHCYLWREAVADLPERVSLID